MFKFNDLKQLHIELTSNCQASCPMCARNYHGGLNNPKLPQGEITLDEFKIIVNTEVLNTVDYIYFCGNYGDPIMSNYLIDIVKYCKDINPAIRIGIHTNGSARSNKWWESLAKALPTNHSVHFALDGLEDTHHIYRAGTSFKNIISNATTFIKHGGRAEWVFLSFKHNEHQVTQAEQMAKQLGFIKFEHKATSRFLEKPFLDVLDKSGNLLYKIEPPSEHKIRFIKPEIIKAYKEVVKTAEIKCKVADNKSLYVDAFKNLWPCCWLGAVPYMYSKSSDIIHEYQSDQTQVINEIINSIGGYDAIDLTKRSIKDILEDDQWQSIWPDYWNKKKLGTCAKTCGEFPEKIITQYSDQFIRTSKFNE